MRRCKNGSKVRERIIMRKAEESQKLTQSWCPFFSSGCPPTYELHQAGGCPLNEEEKFTCTLDRACQPRPVVNGIVTRRSRRREVLLVLRKGTRVQPGKWALPGGGINCGETVEDAVLREVKEETGYDVEVLDNAAQYEHKGHRLFNGSVIPFQVVSAESVDDRRNHIGFFAFCRVVAEPTEEARDTFTSHSHWFDCDQVKELIKDRRITPLDTAVITQQVFRSLQ